jgi:hypothetical protein
VRTGAREGGEEDRVLSHLVRRLEEATGNDGNDDWSSADRAASNESSANRDIDMNSWLPPRLPAAGNGRLDVRVLAREPDGIASFPCFGGLLFTYFCG